MTIPFSVAPIAIKVIVSGDIPVSRSNRRLIGELELPNSSSGNTKTATAETKN